uniref:Amidase n=1 Tax=Dechloromonas aromatica (strain RCB) TaxID=159087 RepID=Q47GC2_DECAR
MSVSELHYLEMTELARCMRKRELSPVEVTAATLARIEALDPKLHAYATVLPEYAMAQAREAERSIMAGEDVGPLCGVPIGVKDLCWVANYPTAAGTTVHRGFVPGEDATVVKRLRAAGAIILGKLQLTEGAFATHHPTIPVPLNPWGEAHWSGASSSGSGVATAAGLCYAAIGTDTGGSIRFPSAANGLTGIKPTWGRVSRYGVFELAASMDHVGSMARSAADAALLLGVMAGHDPLDPTSLPDEGLTLPHEAQDLRGLRVGIDRAWNALGTEPVITQAIDRAINVIAGLGARFIDVAFPDARAVVDEWETNCGVEVAVAHANTFPKFTAEYGPALSRLIELGRATDAMDYQRVLLNRAEFTGRLNKLMQSVDLLILPVQPYAAPTYEQLGALADDPEANSRLIQFTAPINSSGHPAITLPCGFTEQGLPLAFQFIARHGDEAVLCRAGLAFQSATDWHRWHPEIA